MRKSVCSSLDPIRSSPFIIFNKELPRQDADLEHRVPLRLLSHPTFLAVSPMGTAQWDPVAGGWGRYAAICRVHYEDTSA